MFTVLTVAFLQASAPPFRTLDKGAQTSVASAREVTARSDAEWQAMWRQHAAGRPVPPVDFTREMVVGVFLGSRPTAGYAVDIVGARDEQGALVIQYRETRPSPDRITAQVITTPYHLIAVPQHPDAVRFEKIESR